MDESTHPSRAGAMAVQVLTRALPPTTVTRVAAGGVMVATAPFACSAVRRVGSVPWGCNESRTLWLLVAAPGALTVGAAATTATGRLRWMLPSMALAVVGTILVWDHVAGHPTHRGAGRGDRSWMVGPRSRI